MFQLYINQLIIKLFLDQDRCFQPKIVPLYQLDQLIIRVSKKSDLNHHE
jgi:hypothetical protein